MPSISSSKYNVLRACPRLFYWEQVRYIERAKEDGARGFGTLFHSGLEAWWQKAGDGLTPWADEALVAALNGIGAKAKHIDTDPYDVAKAEAMMVAYHAAYIELEFELVGGGVESFYSVPLRDPDGKEVAGWKQTGRKDAMVQLAHLGKPTPVEHKTTGQDITPGSDYWQRVSVDGQISCYIDAARAMELDCDSAYYDVARKPDISPELETPEDKREMTKGRGCKACGGVASGDVKSGSGFVLKERGGKKGDKLIASVEAGELSETCPDCNGSGWSEAPRWKANVRLKDEPVADYKMRVMDKLAENPGLYFQQVSVPRTDEQIREARADLVCATVEIDAYYSRMRSIASSVEDPKARQAFPRNTATCLNIYGRRCDMLPLCSGEVQDPMQSQLYRIRDKRAATGGAK